MRLGILTVPFNNNYGGFLQAYALKTILKKMGHEVFFINRKRNKPQRPLWKKIIGFPLIMFREMRERSLIKKISVHTEVFKRQYLTPITPEYYTHKSLKKCLKLGLDAFVVGSDQVWRYRYARESIDDFFFSFLRDSQIPRFSYAASFGVDDNEYPDKYIELCKMLLNEFEAISVREASGKDLLINQFQISPEKIKVVLDPTFLLTPGEYRHLFQQYPKPKEPYLCTYILDQSSEVKSLVTNAAQSIGMNDVVALVAQTGCVEKLQPIEPVEKWLYAVARASFVITDSFHGTVFSIIFNRPFLTIGNKTRGETRIHSLLNLFGLQSRCVDGAYKFNQSVLFKPIDWDSVNYKINEYKKESLKFITRGLELCKKRKKCLCPK